MNVIRADNKRASTFCIAGTHSGCGKTTVSLGLMSALVERGFIVQAFKVGPDFIDPGHHRRITGRDSHNLDGWIMDRSQNLEIFSRYSHDAEMVVVEGVMGLFDGISGDDESGSTAQMAKWLDIPAILVIDARSMARSAAAIALGYSRFDEKLPIQGIIFNRVGSDVHSAILKDAVTSTLKLPVYGCLPRDEVLEMPSRHLGLMTDEDFRISHIQMKNLARWIENNLGLDSLLSSLRKKSVKAVHDNSCHSPSIRIGIARDEAFCFYYPENLRLLSEAGAELIPFSPLHSRSLPKDIKGLILGGGYPELHCAELAENRGLLDSIREFAWGGGPIYAECGGFMFLMKEIIDLDGDAFGMVNIFPFTAKMETDRKSLGYREVVTRENSILGPAGTKVRGHEFHYSQIQDMHTELEAIYSVSNRKASYRHHEGFVRQRVLGSYIHLHWGSNPSVAANLVNYCRMHG